MAEALQKRNSSKGGGYSNNLQGANENNSNQIYNNINNLNNGGNSSANGGPGMSIAMRMKRNRDA